jgi:Cu2+-exporting ATPase
MNALTPARIDPADGPTTSAAVCRHCGSSLDVDRTDGFCCAGCAAAYEIIQGLGLDRFYAQREIDPTVRPLKPDDELSFDFGPYIVSDGACGSSTLHLMVDGLQCAACVWLIESVLARDPDVIDGRVNMTTRRLRLVWKGNTAKGADLVRTIERLGFRLTPYDPASLGSGRPAAERQLLRALTVAGFAAGNVMLLSMAVWFNRGSMGAATRDLMHWISALIAMPAILYAGMPFFRSAFGALRAVRTNMDVPISIGIVLATGMSLFETIRSQPEAYFDSALTLTFFLLIGRYLDMRTRGRMRSAAEQLVLLNAGHVHVVRPDATIEVRRAHAVHAGEIVQVVAGERIGVDGVVAEGRSEADASLITGETLPQTLQPGTQVYSGMINLAAPVRIAVSATGEGTLLAEIVRLMESAERGRTRWVALADRVSRAYAPAVHLAALLTFLGWYFIGHAPWNEALLYAVAVLIVTCPCALALAVPAVQIAASNRLMRQGILVKSPTALERLAGVDTFVFDKTGTLTQGHLDLVGSSGTTEDLAVAASLASASRHPLSRAISRAAGSVATSANVKEHPGQGLSADTLAGQIRLGNRAFCHVANDVDDMTEPELWLTRPGRAPVQFRFGDRLRDDSVAVCRHLQEAGMAVELLSGDRAPVVDTVARAVEISYWQAGLSPADKTRRLEALRRNHRVAMVGDGLNDAPALTAADISLSPSSASDISQTAADIVFQGAYLSPVEEAWRVARMSQRLIRQNIGFALLYNLCAVPLAVFGQVTPLIAAAAMSSSSIIVVLNALRIARRR